MRPRAGAIDDAILDWYAGHGRDLAFRHTSDPWAILVSEVMAQQTQAARAAAGWTRFMAEFPTVVSLAAASPAAVIRAWRGLGYNRRALALRGAARAIVEQHDGRVPASLEALMQLPGIGPYTARAVLAIAFGRSVAALDVNIRRVIGRAWLGGATPPAKDLQSFADCLVPTGGAAAWTHALMDIGAAFCRPRAPRCDGCPLRSSCLFRAQTLLEPAGVDARAAGRTARPARAASPSMTFGRTNRWLRGRILDALRDAPDGTWLSFQEPIGGHDAPAVQAAIATLAAEGMIEAAGSRARLQIA